MSARDSGRDAAWMASLGYDVIAAEPSTTMPAEARVRHPDPRIVWVSDSLPSIEAVYRLGQSFDLILVSAVWMHLHPAERPRAFRKLINLLKPSGILAVSLRHGPSEPSREMYPVSSEEVASLAKAHGAVVIREGNDGDNDLVGPTSRGPTLRSASPMMARVLCRSCAMSF